MNEYLSTYGKINAASEQDLLIEGENYSEIQGMQTAIVENYKGRPGKAVATEDAGTISWKFDVRQEGLYNLSLMIYSEPGKESDIERELRIDGEIPFNEARSVSFKRIWMNEKQTFDRDSRGNDLVPNQLEEPMWQETSVKDGTGFYEDPFLFYLSQGRHTLSLTSVKEPLVIDQLEAIRTGNNAFLQ